MSDSRELAFSFAKLLVEHKAEDVQVLDLGDLAGWTDFFVLATSTSSVHLRGLARHVDEFAAQMKLESLNKPNPAEDETWILHDFGDFVVHIMERDARAFYELEKLWHKARSVTKLV
ncbi:MAG TPA: ribosome silencing factor [Rectinemataceae bacterium]